MKFGRVPPPIFLAAIVAVLPLPGFPLYSGDDQQIVDQALSDVDTYQDARVDRNPDG